MLGSLVQHTILPWTLSEIKNHLEHRYFEGFRNTFLLGDSGYPLQPWLLTPILNAEENTPEWHYTRAHMHTRNVIERVIGVLKQRFRCTHRHRTLHYSPVIASKIIYSCAFLHNLCINHNIEAENDEIPVDEEEGGKCYL